jgi:DNA mismatch endonuclease (patch repair protein)
MVDEVRSRIMRANRARDTKPKVRLRRALHARGLRYRIAARDLPGTPDLAFPRWKAVVFVNGCYWHHHRGCRRATVPKSNRDFWIAKFETNRARDARNVEALLQLGWRVGIVWECARDPVEDVVAFVRGMARFAEWEGDLDRTA